MNDDRMLEADSDLPSPSDTHDHTKGILAADDTGLVSNEVTITEVELREGELLPPV